MTDTLTDERLAEIEARAEAATAGPWVMSKYSEGKGGWISGLYGEWTEITITADTARAVSNKDFIAAARQDVPALCKAVKEAREQETIKHGQMQHWRGKANEHREALAAKDAEIARLRKDLAEHKALLFEAAQEMERAIPAVRRIVTRNALAKP